MRLFSWLAVLLVCAPAAWAQFSQPDGGDLEPGSLPIHWNTGGPKCMEVPDWQVHEYNPNLFILRQSGCTDYEMPFLYLFFGKDKGLLWDTGSRNGDLVPILQHVVHQWLQRNHRDSVPLIVMHSHSHGDHVWGDKAIQALVDPVMPITFVAPTIEAVSKVSAMERWADMNGQIDLGGRLLDIVPIPGHDRCSVAMYDRATGIVLTGDSLYPGRLYISDFQSFRISTDRLVAFLKGKPVAHIFGNHIEETDTPFKDFPIGSIFHPGEHRLELSYGDLLALDEALQSMAAAPHRLALSDFTIWPRGTTHELHVDQLRKTLRETQEEQQKYRWDQPH